MAYTTINKPSDYFNTKLYTGTGATQSITGVGFQPDFTWIKGRTYIEDHMLQNSISGSIKTLRSNSTGAEYTPTGGLSSFDADGFSIGSDVAMNKVSESMCSWNWLADNTSGSSNTDGSITSTVSANTTSGFSIVSYTGTNASATVGHGLGAVPKVIIVKCRTTVDNWGVYTAMTGNTSKLRLNGSNATITGVSSWDSTTPTSSVFSLGADTEVNNTSSTIAYCFAEVNGFSKFGTYTGNGSADGTFVYTGFKPAFVLVKNTTGDHWNLSDNKRNPSNQVNRNLYPNLSNVEGTTAGLLDYLSNGFKLRDIDSSHNGSGVSYVYMAFAENPLVTSTKLPATAR